MLKLGIVIQRSLLLSWIKQNLSNLKKYKNLTSIDSNQLWDDIITTFHQKYKENGVSLECIYPARFTIEKIQRQNKRIHPSCYLVLNQYPISLTELKKFNPPIIWYTILESFGLKDSDSDPIFFTTEELLERLD